MRWVVAGVLGLIVVWGSYLASPYLALYRLGVAVEARNVTEVAKRVNVRALRYSLARQIAADIAAADPSPNGIATADAQLAANAALALADPVLNTFVSPSGLIELLGRVPAGMKDGSVFGTGTVDLEDLEDFLFASNWRGFRTVYFNLPPGTPLASRYRLQLRLGRLRWRVVGLELPAYVRGQIVSDILRARTR